MNDLTEKWIRIFFLGIALAYAIITVAIVVYKKGYFLPEYAFAIAIFTFAVYAILRILTKGDDKNEN